MIDDLLPKIKCRSEAEVIISCEIALKEYDICIRSLSCYCRSKQV